MRAAEAVFFDFDGPLCDVFAGHPAAGVAEELKHVASSFGVVLPGPLRTSADPHGILRGLSLLRAGAEPAGGDEEFFAAMEETLVRQEMSAATSAKPTDHALEVVVALHGRGKRLLVTSNNAASAVWSHLRAEGIEGFFSHVVGRDSRDPLLMKPHPHCVHRALELVGLPPDDCLLIGDQPTDAQAAAAAGVPFLGYAPDSATADALRTANVANLMTSLGEMLLALQPSP